LNHAEASLKVLAAKEELANHKAEHRAILWKARWEMVSAIFQSVLSIGTLWALLWALGWINAHVTVVKLVVTP
jgi:hypothetical protein